MYLVLPRFAAASVDPICRQRSLECQVPAKGIPTATPAAATIRRVAGCRLVVTRCTLALCNAHSESKEYDCVLGLADHAYCDSHLIPYANAGGRACRLAAIRYVHEMQCDVLGPMAWYVLPLQVPDSKSCSGCGILLPADSFYRCASNIDGLTSRCIECQKFCATENKRQRSAFPAPMLPAAKRCGGPCGRLLLLANFANQRSSADRHFSECKQCRAMRYRQQVSQAFGDK